MILMDMSDEGCEIAGIGVDVLEERGDSSSEEFVRIALRVAVAQLCESVGYQGARLSALDALLELAVGYISDAGKVAAYYANLSGRTECSIFEVVRALEEVNSLCSGSSEVDSIGSATNLGVVDGIERYMASFEDIPFALPTPCFPIVCGTKQTVSFARSGGVPPGKHIPDWLPQLPDQHTYIQTPVWNERTSDPKEERLEQARQRRKAEWSLLNLQRRLAGSCSGASKQPNGASTEDWETLPFPVKDDGTKDKGSSVLDIFRPAIEALTNGTFDTVNNRVLPIEKPFFRFGFSKKTLDTPIYLGVQRSETINSCTLGADEKDDKKRRAQLIIKSAMDNPQELHQL